MVSTSGPFYKLPFDEPLLSIFQAGMSTRKCIKKEIKHYILIISPTTGARNGNSQNV